MIDASATRHHVCERPPQIFHVTGSMALDGPGEPLELHMDHPVGTRHICDVCGRVLVVRWVEGYECGSVAVMGNYDWVPETRRERRRRLGLQWWQREQFQTSA